MSQLNLVARPSQWHYINQMFVSPVWGLSRHQIDCFRGSWASVKSVFPSSWSGTVSPSPQSSPLWAPHERCTLPGVLLPPWYVLNSTSQRNMISLQTVMVINDHDHHELQQCLLKETSSKHVGGWCFFLRYLFTSPPRQSYRQWHLTLSTFSRQWCWLTKVVLPRSSQQHCGYNTIILTSREF